MSTEILSDKNVSEGKAKITGLVRQYRDLNLSYRVHPKSGDIRPVRDLDAIKNSIKNILSTERGEKPFRPDFGCNLNSYLFEPADNITKASIRDSIEKSIGDHEPRVEVVEVAIEDYPDRNEYAITITVMVVNSQQQIDLEFILERLR